MDDLAHLLVDTRLALGWDTGLGGGILCDIPVGEVPLVLADRQLYATPALADAGLTAAFWYAGPLNGVTQAVVVVLVVGFWLLALRLGWVVPDAQLWRIRGRASDA